MKNIKPAPPEVIEGYKYFDPYHNNQKKKFPCCCCGFELIKKDEFVYECIGGAHHRYFIQNGDFIKDKFGNLWFKRPEESAKTKKGKK